MDDNFDMSDFVNFDQGFGASPTPAASKLESSASLSSAPSAFSAQGLPMQHMAGQQPQQHQQHQRQYNGPSHDYSGFTQQVGLPTGATQHIDAVNAFSRQVRPAAFNPQRLVAYNSGFEMDTEAGPSNDPHSYFSAGDGSVDDFAVDPSALGPDAASKSRAWPGMHSQQAKAQEAARQAQLNAHQQQREQQLGKQRQLPMDFEQTYAADSSSHQSEPQVNEQITKLLNQMRHNSDASSNGDMDGANSQSGYDLPSMSKLKRDEDDLDEDERLLASEEGKKLSSKERRQLRNKVSARAFRSRRKEYITQLEGEVATKTSEANDLKQTNQHLLEQNRQLTQLTKAMLAHPAFNNFMQDMSNDPSFLNSFGSAHARQQASQQQQQQQSLKQEQQQTHENIQVGMTMIPENNLDLSTLNLGANHWGSGSFQQPQIFAVHSLPDGPLIENLLPSSVDPKSKEDVVAASTEIPSKTLLPSVEVRAPVTESKSAYPALVNTPDVNDDPTFALYASSPAVTPVKSAPVSTVADACRQLELSLSTKSTPSFNLKVSRRPLDEATAVREVERMFASLEPAASRIAAMAFHLPQ